MVNNPIEQLSEEFDNLCTERHIMGQMKYGDFTFLETDVFRMLIEELADAANYLRYHYIKLRLLQMYMEKELPLDDEDFKGLFTRD